MKWKRFQVKDKSDKKAEETEMKYFIFNWRFPPKEK